jgi:3-methylfumaryl-CoA hydratase
VFFGETVRQSELGPDGHPNMGIVLPPIPMPRAWAPGAAYRSWAACVPGSRR